MAVKQGWTQRFDDKIPLIDIALDIGMIWVIDLTDGASCLSKGESL